MATGCWGCPSDHIFLHTHITCTKACALGVGTWPQAAGGAPVTIFSCTARYAYMTQLLKHRYMATGCRGRPSDQIFQHVT